MRARLQQQQQPHAHIRTHVGEALCDDVYSWSNCECAFFRQKMNLTLASKKKLVIHNVFWIWVKFYMADGILPAHHDHRHRHCLRHQQQQLSILCMRYRPCWVCVECRRCKQFCLLKFESVLTNVTKNVRAQQFTLKNCSRHICRQPYAKCATSVSIKCCCALQLF